MPEHFDVSSFSQLPIIKGKSYWIWLASWYPSKSSPTNGDFIQRQAISVAAHHPLIVIHCIHDANALKPLYYVFTENESLIEIIIYFSHTGNVKGLKNKLVYNYLFYKTILTFINKLLCKIAIPRFIHVHVPMKMGVVARWIKAKLKIPYLVSEHSSEIIPIKPDSFKNRSLFYKIQVKKTFRNAIVVTNVSNAIGEILQKTFRLKEVLVIHNQADTTIFKYKEVEKPVFRFIHISTMRYEKNFTGIISVFNELSKIRNDFELIIVGEVPDGVKQLIEHTSKMFTIKAIGLLKNIEVANQLQQSNCMVMFSKTENFPCVIVESLCCGIPVITSDVGGAAEAINESNGIVVQSEDELSLLSAVQNIITNYSLYNSEQIAFDAAKLYSGSNIANKFLEIYQRLKLV